MSTLEIGLAPLSARRLAEAAHDGHVVVLTAAAWARIEAAHATVLRLAGSGAAIYGVTTGLGAVVDTAVAAHDPELQRRVVRARAVAVGEPASDVEVRAMMIARLAGFSRGVSGVSAPTVRAYAAMLAAGILPVVPLTGSLGEADLAPLAHLALVLIGEGEVRRGGETLAGAQALAAAGLAPSVLGPKDGLALVSSNAVSVGLGALAVEAARHALAALVEAAALSFEAQRANPGPLGADIVALHPTPGQAAVAAAIRSLLAGGALAEAGAGRRLHDPLSFRCVAPVLGALLAAIEAADAAVTLELNASDDNPAVLADAIRGTASFETTHLALVFETLAQAMARAAAVTGARITQLMRAEITGLPRFLTMRGAEGRSGMAPLGKTAASLVAEIAQGALPLPAGVLPVADGLEDYATMTVPIVRKAAASARLLATLASVEMVVAAQAIDLREEVRLGAGTAARHAAVRAVVAVLDEDRSLGAELAALDAALRARPPDDVLWCS